MHKSHTRFVLTQPITNLFDLNIKQRGSEEVAFRAVASDWILVWRAYLNAELLYPEVYLEPSVFIWQRPPSLTYFSPMSHFYTPWKRPKTIGLKTS